MFFDVIAIPTGDGLTMEFVTYVGQRGDNKAGMEYIETTNNLFALDSFIIDYNVPNTAYVGGSGKGLIDVWFCTSATGLK